MALELTNGAKMDIIVDGTKLKKFNLYNMVIIESLGRLPIIDLALSDEEPFAKYHDKDITIKYYSDTVTWDMKFLSTGNIINKRGLKLSGINSSYKNHHDIHLDVFDGSLNNLFQKVGDGRSVDGITSYSLTYPCINLTYNKALLNLIKVGQTDEYPICITTTKIRKMGSGDIKEFNIPQVSVNRLQTMKRREIKLKEEQKKIMSITDNSGFTKYSENRTYLKNFANYYNYNNMWTYEFHVHYSRVEVNFNLGDAVKLDDNTATTKKHYITEKTTFLSTTKQFTDLVLGGMS